MGNLPGEMVESAEMTAKKSAKQQKWLRFAAIPACACLIVGGIAGARIFTAPKMEIHINELSGSLADYTPMIKLNAVSEFYTGMPENELLAAKEAFAVNTGMDYEAFEAKIPEDLEMTLFSALITPANAEGAEEQKLRDYIFYFGTEAEGEMKLAVSAVGKPLSCVKYPPADYAPSTVNGEEILILSAGDEYLVEFTSDALYYTIETDGISEELLTEVLGNLTK